MVNLNELLTSVKATLRADGDLCEALGTQTGDRVLIGPDFPENVPERFISLSILSNVQEIEDPALEFTTLGVTVAVLFAHNDEADYGILSDISQRVNVLLQNQTSAVTFSNDLIGYLSREGGLPPDTDFIGEEKFLLSQDRFELLTTEG